MPAHIAGIGATAAAAMNGDLDVYGFPVRLSAQQAGARARCDNNEKKAAKTWFKFAKKNQAPSGDEAKKLCRKVSDVVTYRITLHCPCFLPTGRTAQR